MEQAARSLAGRRALVCGGGSGIGAATARALAGERARVLVADQKNAAGLEAPIDFQRTDVGRGEDIDALHAAARERLGGVDALISCAGVGIHERLDQGDPRKWARVLEVNLLGALRLIRAFVPDMLAQGAGDVVVVSSVAARQAYPWGGIYAASKAALEMVAETLRLECLPTLRVLTLAPGVVDTPFFDHIINGNQSVESIGFGSVSPEQVADLILFALSRPPEMALNELVVRPRAQPF